MLIDLTSWRVYLALGTNNRRSTNIYNLCIMLTNHFLKHSEGQSMYFEIHLSKIIKILSLLVGCGRKMNKASLSRLREGALRWSTLSENIKASFRKSVATIRQTDEGWNDSKDTEWVWEMARIWFPLTQVIYHEYLVLCLHMVYCIYYNFPLKASSPVRCTEFIFHP